MSLGAWLESSRLLSALGWSLLHVLWQGALLTVLALGAERVTRNVRPALRYWAACVLLAAFPFLALLSLTVHLIGAEPVSGAPSPDSTWVQLLGASYVPVAIAAVGACWTLGAVLGLFRVGGAVLWLNRRPGREVAPVEGPWRERFEKLRERLGVHRRVALVRSRGPVPEVAGVVRTVVAMPAVPAGRDEEMAALLAHEVAHVRCRDPLAKLLQSVVLALFFFHPGVHLLGRMIDHEREKRCDDLAAAVTGRRLLGHALANLALAPAVSARGLSAGGSPLSERVERLLREPRPARGGSSWIVGAAVVLVLLAAPPAATSMLELTAGAVPVGGWGGAIVFNATDPAGHFTLAVDRGRAKAATIDGRSVASERIRQIGSWVVIRATDPDQSLRLKLVPPQRILWTARASRTD